MFSGDAPPLNPRGLSTPGVPVRSVPFITERLGDAVRPGVVQEGVTGGFGGAESVEGQVKCCLPHLAPESAAAKVGANQEKVVTVP